MKKNLRKSSHHLKASHVSAKMWFSEKHSIVVISGLCLLAVGLSLVINKRPITRAVEGASIFRPLFSQATISLPRIDGAKAFNIYYRAAADTTFTHAARNISPLVDNYTIEYLKKGVTYVYVISAVNTSGAEYWWSESIPMRETSPM